MGDHLGAIVGRDLLRHIPMCEPGVNTLAVTEHKGVWQLRVEVVHYQVEPLVMQLTTDVMLQMFFVLRCQCNGCMGGCTAGALVLQLRRQAVLGLSLLDFPGHHSTSQHCCLSLTWDHCAESMGDKGVVSTWHSHAGWCKSPSSGGTLCLPYLRRLTSPMNILLNGARP